MIARSHSLRLCAKPVSEPTLLLHLLIIVLQELAQDSAIKMVEKRETDWLVILVEHDNDPKYQKKKSGQWWKGSRVPIFKPHWAGLALAGHTEMLHCASSFNNWKNQVFSFF